MHNIVGTTGFWHIIISTFMEQNNVWIVGWDERGMKRQSDGWQA
jgi:hypothetical protein